MVNIPLPMDWIMITEPARVALPGLRRMQVPGVLGGNNENE